MSSTPTALFGATASTIATANSLAPAVTNAKPLDSKSVQAITQLIQTFSLSKVDDQTVVMFGIERQKAASAALDNILSEVTKGSSPLLFELFRQLQKGVEETDLGGLESKIQQSLNKKWWHSILDSLHLSSVAKRIEKGSDQIGALLTSKAVSLQALTGAMEKNIAEEVSKLIVDAKRLDKLADEFRDNITTFSIYTQAGRQILADGKKESARRTELATASNDPLEIEAAKKFEQKVDMFESRLLVLETVLAKAPVELESIRLTQKAALETLGETANGALSEFNDIKSILIKLATAHRIQNTQSINAERRKIRDQLQSHGTNVLGNVAVNAARAQGQNRLDDATKLVEFANNINTITKKVKDEEVANKSRYAESYTKLTEVKKLMGQSEVIDI